MSPEPLKTLSESIRESIEARYDSGEAEIAEEIERSRNMLLGYMLASLIASKPDLSITRYEAKAAKCVCAAIPGAALARMVSWRILMDVVNLSPLERVFCGTQHSKVMQGWEGVLRMTLKAWRDSLTIDRIHG